MTTLFDIVMPVLALIALGYGLSRVGIVTAAGEAAISQLVFFVTTPALLFRAMATTDLPGLREAGALVAYFGPCFLLYGTSLALSLRQQPRRWASAGVQAMGASFGNTVLIGIPIVERAFGVEGLRVLVLIVSVHSATLFTLTTILAEADRGGPDWRETLAGTARAMARNMIVLSILGGALWRLAGWPLGSPVDGALGLLGSATVPLALIAVGAGLAAFRVEHGLGAVVRICAFKLALFPILVWLAARFALGLDPLTVAVATIAAAMPVGTNAYVLARRYGVDEAVIAGAILVSTVASAASVPALLAVLR